MDILEEAYYIASFESAPEGIDLDGLAELAIESLAGSNIHPVGMIAACRQRILNDPIISPRVKDWAKHELHP
ncbi:MAG: hypothetical protein AAB928_01135 [Patescibacteria group bacterium]